MSVIVLGKSVLKGDSDDDGNSNTYDYDDSFLDEDNDESYEDSEDEDFVPSDNGGGDDADEDISELMSEAKDFIDA